MKFDIDEQTFNDLGLIDSQKSKQSIFSLFDYTITKGGRKFLQDLFLHPLTDIDQINHRISSIQCFLTASPYFALKNEGIEYIEIYLTQQNIPNRHSFSKSYLRELTYYYNPDNEYYLIKKGVTYGLQLLNELYSYSQSDDNDLTHPFIEEFKTRLKKIVNESPLHELLKLRTKKKLLPNDIGKLDFYFRKKMAAEFKKLLSLFYEIDAYQSIALATIKHNFTLPKLTTKPDYVAITDLFHPFIKHPVKNNIELKNKRICFLTGPNMAGKSTFLKSISICIYLSHIGFPVPASSLTTSLFKGLLTTINLPDNIDKGYSHYYNEVLRVKHIANRISQTGNLFIVFDELFRGTNVKDAYEASLSVIDALSKLNKGIYAISTHIIEVAEKLRSNPNITFQYFEANMRDHTPNYTYKISEGITDERLGLYILNKEKVVETIEKSIVLTSL